MFTIIKETTAWDAMKQAIRESDLTGVLEENSYDVNNAWNNVGNSIITLYIPLFRLKNINSPPWIDGEVIALSKRKETARKKARRTDSPQAWASYKRLRNSLRTLTRRKYNEYISIFLRA